MPTFVIRPGETDYDVQGRVQGSLDLPLSSRGQQQVDEVIETLRGAGLEVIYTSPTEPALTTARRLAQALDVPLRILSRLANLDHGLWQGLCLSEIRQKQPRVFKQWEDAPESVCPPQGEPLEEAALRVTRALRRPLRRRGETFAVVASEPLASLVSCVLRGERPRLPGPISAIPERPRIERLEDDHVVSATESWGWARQ